MSDGGVEAGQQEQTGGQTGTLAQSLTHSVTHRVTHSLFFYRECRSRSSILPIHVSDTAVTNQDGSYLEFVAVTVGRECNIQDARAVYYVL